MFLSVRRLLVSVFVVVVGVLVFASASALATAPEAPGPVTAEHFGATKVTVHGLLSPNAEGHPGTYEFLYRTSKTECEGGEHAPSAPGLAIGAEGEEVSQGLTGLTPETEYTVCLVERNLNQAKGEETIGPALTIKTTGVLEAPATTVPTSASITSSSAKLQGVLNPDNPGNPGSYEFVYRQSASECERENPETHRMEGEHATSTERALGNEKEVVPTTGPVEVGGLLPNVEYTVCLLARNEAGETALGAPVTFATLSQNPGVTGESVSHVGSVSAIVSAQIDTGGIEANYRVQYGTTASYGAETPATNLSPGSPSVSVPLSGLQPDTEYHFRFIANNHDGVEPGADVSFTTYTTDTGVLPDNRVYEMVSPPENHNADVYNVAELGNTLFYTQKPFEAAANGDAVVYEAAPTTGGNGSSGNEKGNTYLGSRSPEGAWSQTNITPPGSLIGTEYQAFSSDLSTGFVSIVTVPPFVVTEVPKQFETTLESEEIHPDLYSRSFDENDFRPIFAKTPPHRSEQEFGGAIGLGFERSVYSGSSVDLTHVLFEANDALLEGNGQLEKELNSNVEKEVEENKEATRLHQEGGQTKQEESEALEAVGDRGELYVSVDGRPTLVNVSPEGKPMPGATFGGTPSGGTNRKEPGFSHVISADGSRIFWTSVENVPVEIASENLFEARSLGVYMREDGAKTIQVSPGPARFWTASTDGSYAFYTETGKLWRFDVENQTRVELAGSAGGVQGVIGTNETGEDGTYVYFVAQEAFAGTENDVKQKPVVGADNLYVYKPDTTSPGTSRIAFIGTLSEEDRTDWSLGLGERTVNLTPDGRGLVFAAHENLTGHPYPGEGSNEVYVYDTQDSSLYCASCRSQASGGHLTPTLNLTYVYRWISEDGDRVFFDSSAPLVSQDINNVQDVYEWERDGHDGCEESDGCVYLISSGFGEQASLVDASTTGNDVFFVTPERLTPEDGNETVDMYDARVNGVRPVAVPVCTGTGCQGAPASAPVFATPASVTFGGVGNFPAPTEAVMKVKKAKPLTRSQKLVRALGSCRKRPRGKARSVCEARARKLYEAHKAGMSSKRRAK